MIIIKSYSILSNYVGLNKNMGYDKVIKLYINYRTFGSDVKQNNKGTHFFIISYDLIKEKYKTKLEILNFVRDLENNGTICHIVNTNPKYIVETIRLYEEFNNHKLKTIFSNDMSNFFEVVYNDETGWTTILYTGYKIKNFKIKMPVRLNIYKVLPPEHFNIRNVKNVTELLFNELLKINRTEISQDNFSKYLDKLLNLIYKKFEKQNIGIDFSNLILLIEETTIEFMQENNF